MHPLKSAIAILAVSTSIGFARGASAEVVYDLSADITSSVTNTFNQWSLLFADNIVEPGGDPFNVSTYAPLTQRDINATADREIWYVNTAGSPPFTNPRVQTQNYTTSDPLVRLFSSSVSDVIVAWTSPGDLNLVITGSVLDTGGGTTPDEDAEHFLRVSQYTGSGPDTNVVQTVTIPDNGASATPFSFSLTVSTGDILYFRKTFDAALVDGQNPTDFDLQITANAVPEPSSMALTIGGVALLVSDRRRAVRSNNI